MPALLAPVAACTPAPAAVAPTPALAYGVPAPALMDYLMGDTSRVEIRAADQSFPVDAAASERWRMEFAPAGDGSRITATLVDFSGSLICPLTAPQTIDESALSGPLVFTLDRRGRATIETLPGVTPAAVQLVSGAQIAHTFFPRLPGRAVTTTGESWVDTVAFTGEESGVRITSSYVTIYTGAADSLAGSAG